MRTSLFNIPILFRFPKIKHFNDEYGHIQGDQVLTRLGDVIRAQVRDKDYACRYGGEEFAVIMPGVSEDRAMEAAERIRKAFGGQPFAPRAGKKIQVTVSIGAARYEPGLMPDDFVDRADQALYRAKAAGKNQTMQWQEFQAGSLSGQNTGMES